MTTKKRKRKILATSESAKASGFGKYYREVLTRLHNSGKFEIAELAGYACINDEKIRNTPWKVYPNHILPNDSRFKEFIENPMAVFGSWRFNKVLLDFRPDITFSLKDFWMDTYIQESPLRPYFYFAWAPTCDSSPIKEEWIEKICEADAVFAYNDWSLERMKEESCGRANTICSVYPGIDPAIFFPATDIQEQKKKMMFRPDSILIGMVARNQKRKLYPDLFIAFNLFLNNCYRLGHHKLAHKTFLFCHTSYPEGWNLPLLLKEQNISHKVLFSYICRNCKEWFPAFYSEVKAICPFCNSLAASMPSPDLGVSEEKLADIYRCLDLYSHLHIAAGAEIPLIEASGCGVHCMASDNTAVTDIIRKVNGTPLKLAHTFRELETGAYRHYTDIENLAWKWHLYLTGDFDHRKKIEGENARKGVLEYFTWDKTAKIWEDHLENCQLTGLQGKWDSPPNFVRPRINPDFDEMTNMEFVQYLFNDVLQQPEKLYKYEAMKLLSILNFGGEIEGKKIHHVNKKDIHQRFIGLAESHNECESIRCGLRKLPQEDFLQYANMRK